MATYDRLRDLPLKVDDYRLEPVKKVVSSGFERHTTVIRLSGGEHEGCGEDVTYIAADQLAFQQAGGSHPLAGQTTFDGFSELLDRLELFPGPTEAEASRYYRRWAFESAALDLALRQAGISLAAALDIEPRPIRFVVSCSLGKPPTVEPVRRWRSLYPELRFKLDGTSAWDDALIEDLAAVCAVDIIDLKGAYKGTPVDQGADPDLYMRIAEGFPHAWIEDPALTPETEAIFAGAEQRFTWDAPIHGVDDVEALKYRPRMINIKPSRFGSVRSLMDAYDHCSGAGIGMYGGGQFELGPGRGHIQYLASLFHPDGPNDVAPTGYNAPEPVPGLPISPLEPQASATGFCWEES